MASGLAVSVERWCETRAIEKAARPSQSLLEARFGGRPDPTLPPISRREIDHWESRHGHSLPDGLKAWLELSNGFQVGGPVIHPLAGIGPMVPFARMPSVVVQPESWFEIGNPNVETVCVDLAYRMPGGDFPLFTSGDDHTGSRPRIIATGFDSWFLGVLQHGAREYWFDDGYPDLGDPWVEHRRHVPKPALNEHLRSLAPAVEDLLREKHDERAIAQTLGLSRFDIEAIARFLQHHQPISE